MNNAREDYREREEAMDWMEIFHKETSAVVTEPLFCCMCEAVAMVESGRGRWPILGAEGLNEIGYKALAGHPSRRIATREFNGDELAPTMADFRLFANREEQARALLWLMRSSRYYEACRLLFLLAFYSAYAPGCEAGAQAVVLAFNERARTGVHPGVLPIDMIDKNSMGRVELAMNHDAARRAVRLFAEWTQPEASADGEHHG